MIDRQDRLDEIEGIRQSLELTQGSMASLMGMSVRGYEELASGRTQVRHLHVAAARQAAIEYAVSAGLVGQLPEHLCVFIREAAAALKRANKKPAG